MTERRCSPDSEIDRRAVLRSGVAIGAATLAGMSLAATEPSRAQEEGAVIARAVPGTGETLPSLGLGTFLTFDTLPGARRDHLREVLRIYAEAGVRVVDTSPLYGSGETTVGDFATDLGLNDRLFFADKLWTTGDFLWDESHARRSIEQSQSRLWRRTLDLVQCHSLVNVDMIVPILQAWKKEDRIRYLGVTHHESPYQHLLAGWIERGGIDFVQVNYSIATRSAEDRVLPAAADRGVAVLVNMPLEKARLHKLVAGRPLPDFAAEIGITAWSQFFLKWVMAHPAVTTVLAATSDPEHARENVGALKGPLPDREMRRRMLRHMETVPGFADVARMPWYPDKRYPGLIGRAQSEIRART